MPIGSAAPSIACATSWPSCPRSRCSTNGCDERTGGARWGDESTGRRKRLRTLVGELERDYHLPQLVWPTICRPSPFISPIRSLYVSGCAPTNLMERSLEEVRRRTKVIGRFPDETSCLTLAWRSWTIVIAGARGLALTSPDRGAIAALVAARSIPTASKWPNLSERRSLRRHASPADPGRDLVKVSES